MIRFSVLINIVPILLLVSFNVQAVTLTATQDAFTQDNKPNNNFGGALRLKVSNGPIKTGFIEFDVSTLSGLIIDDVILKLPLTNVVDGGNISLKAVTGNWSENTITYNNMPGLGAEIYNFALSAGNEGTTISIDVTDTVKAWIDGTSTNYGLALETSNANVKFSTKEDGNPPLLVVSEGVNPTGTRVNVPGDYDTLQAAFDGIEKTWCPFEANECTIILGIGTFDGGEYHRYGLLTIVGMGQKLTTIKSIATCCDGDILGLWDLTVSDNILGGDNSEIITHSVNAVTANISLDEANLNLNYSTIAVASGQFHNIRMRYSKATDIYGRCQLYNSEVENLHADEGKAIVSNSKIGSVSVMFNGSLEMNSSLSGNIFVDSDSRASISNSKTGDISGNDTVCINVVDFNYNERLTDCSVAP